MAAAAATVSAATYYASPTGAADAACTADDPGTVAAAIGKASKRTSWDNGDEIVLLAGTYDYSDPAWSGKNCVDVPQNKDYLTIRSASGDSANTILLGRGSETYVSEDLLTTNSPFYARAIYSSKSKIRVRGLTITNFYLNANGVALGASSANLIDEVSNCVIAGNTGAAGSALASHRVVTDTVFAGNRTTGSGGVFNGSTGFFITNCLFVSNYAAGSGGVGSNICGTFFNCVFTNNSSVSEAGCITGNSNARNLYFENCLFACNTSSSGGVGKYLGGISTNCVFIGNHATGDNGAVTQYAGVPSFYNCRFEGNYAGSNYGTCNNLNAYGCVFVGNHAKRGSGGAIGVGTCVIADCVFSNNWAKDGGAVRAQNNYKPVITNCLFAYNCATNNGGAFTGATHAVYDSLFVENVATNDGGVSNYGGAFYHCRFLRNSAKNGGVAVNVPVPVFHDCDFIENSATGSGGVLKAGDVQRCLFLRNRANSYAAFSSSDGMNVRNCIFESNKANDYALAATGAIYNCLIISNETTSTTHGLFYVGAPVNCTLVGNRTANKPLLPRGATNCILADNLPQDIGSVGYTFQNCLYGTRTGSAPLADCVQTNNPHFNLGHNPKLAWYAPRKRSPARDAGAEQSWAADSLDLAGNGRLYGEIDIGCYELWPSTDGTKVLLR
ncbi:MAG: hypothetical protein IJQ73_00210 [Kiritimatiellae bacterium]|nr:hypothetical protein [Kiritimatiellia bacterium]